MKRVMILASVAMVGLTTTVAGQPNLGAWPRVYDYKASLKTTVAKNIANVSWKDCVSGDTVSLKDLGVCYRMKGTVTVKGLLLFGCDCSGLTDADLSITAYATNKPAYQVALFSTSKVNYKSVVVADQWDVVVANRLGSAYNPKAKVAEMAFGLGFTMGSTNACGQVYQLYNAGFGTASVIEAGVLDVLDITTISGNVAGSVTAPFCSASASDCLFCLYPGSCEQAIGFAPCVVDCENQITDTATDTDVAYGTFTLKYNKTLAKAISQVNPSDVDAAVAILLPKVFGVGAVVELMQ